MVTRIRHHQSKAGKPMGFVALEDIQGVIELVVFPSVWAKVRDILDYDRIVLVDGRVDVGGAEPKVLVDHVTTDFSITASIDEKRAAEPPRSGGNAFRNTRLTQKNDQTTNSLEVDHPPVEREVEAAPVVKAIIESDDDMPPPPDTFPPEWQSVESGAVELMVPAIRTAEPAAPAEEPPKEAVIDNESGEATIQKLGGSRSFSSPGRRTRGRR